MILKGIVFGVTLVTHFWLINEWSLENSMGNTLALVAATILLAFLVFFPVWNVIKKREFLTLYKKKWMQGTSFLVDQPISSAFLTQLLSRWGRSAAFGGQVVCRNLQERCKDER